MDTRNIFLRHMAQTSPAPMALHITSASGNYLYDADGKSYLDLIGGISVCNIGHRHPAVVDAITGQARDYLHIMVYGELVQNPQARYARLLAEHLPGQLDCVYFTNSGAEAVEGALKLARRVTGKTDVIACNNSYHGSTLGALSVMGDEYWRNAYRPLLPGVWHYDYNSSELIEAINEDTSCVLIETIQAEAGVIEPDIKWLTSLRNKCNETGALLIFDEIQCGFGRTGKLWGFEHYGIQPDILLLGKALGGGMPLGAFISSYNNMQAFTDNPVLGHITTFGGHPVCCAAGEAAMQVLLQQKLVDNVTAKGDLFLQKLRHPAIRAVRGMGLLIALELESAEKVLEVVQKCVDKGLFTDWFLFAQNCLRIAPPLTITDEEIERACSIILSCL
ncbi:MAG: aspartate aminotransferase family protein [Chitinophagales bacterium]|nr:aspartate aminotransferase family protein [Chitinophagales bacterium]